MDFYYNVTIIFREKHKDGQHRKTVLRVKARTSSNAARRAIRKVVDAKRHDLINMKVHDLDRMPVCKRKRAKWLRDHEHNAER